MSNPYRILVADDFEDIRKCHSNNLRQCGIIEIEEACNGKELLEKALSKPFDLVLTDWHMPELTGYEATVILRARGFIQPIILCTDESDERKIERAIENGVTDIIKKPYSPSYFRAQITKRLQGNESAGKKYAETDLSRG